MVETTMFVCSNIGMLGTTECHVKQRDDGLFEARMGFSVFGAPNMSEEQFKKCNYNPFHEEFYDNYHKGVGNTKDEAIENMKKDSEETYESIWL